MDKVKALKVAKVAGIISGAFVFGAGIGVSITAAVVLENNQANAALPSLTQMQQFYDEVGCNTAYQTRTVAGQNGNGFFFLKNSQTRLSVPSEPIKINICFDGLTEEQKEIFSSATDEINEIFSVINSAYQFDVNFEPSASDIKAKNNIDISCMSDEEIEKSRAMGKEVYGSWNGTTYRYDLSSKSVTTSDSIIKLNPLLLQQQYADEAIGTIQHELFHHLGLGDGYLIPEQIDCPTIMAHNDALGEHIRKNDVALIAGKYGDYSTPEKKAELIEYIDNYETSQAWGQEFVTDRQEIVDYFVAKGFSEEDIEFNNQDCYTYYSYASIPSLEFYTSYYYMTSISNGKYEKLSYSFTQNATEDSFDKVINRTNGIDVEYFADMTTPVGMKNSYYVRVQNILYEMNKNKEGQWVPDYCGIVITKQKYLEYSAKIAEIAENGTPSQLDALYKYIQNDIAKQEEAE